MEEVINIIAVVGTLIPSKILLKFSEPHPVSKSAEAGHEKELRATADDNITSPGAAEHLLLHLLLLFLYVPLLLQAHKMIFTLIPLMKSRGSGPLHKRVRSLAQPFCHLILHTCNHFTWLKAYKGQRPFGFLGFKREFELGVKITIHQTGSLPTANCEAEE